MQRSHVQRRALLDPAYWRAKHSGVQILPDAQKADETDEQYAKRVAALNKRRASFIAVDILLLRNAVSEFPDRGPVRRHLVIEENVAGAVPVWSMTVDDIVALAANLLRPATIDEFGPVAGANLINTRTKMEKMFTVARVTDALSNRARGASNADTGKWTVLEGWARFVDAQLARQARQVAGPRFFDDYAAFSGAGDAQQRRKEMFARVAAQLGLRAMFTNVVARYMSTRDIFNNTALLYEAVTAGDVDFLRWAMGVLFDEVGVARRKELRNNARFEIRRAYAYKVPSKEISDYVLARFFLPDDALPIYRVAFMLDAGDRIAHAVRIGLVSLDEAIANSLAPLGKHLHVATFVRVLEEISEAGIRFPEYISLKTVFRATWRMADERLRAFLTFINQRYPDFVRENKDVVLKVALGIGAQFYGQLSVDLGVKTAVDDVMRMTQGPHERLETVLAAFHAQNPNDDKLPPAFFANEHVPVDILRAEAVRDPSARLNTEWSARLVRSAFPDAEIIVLFQRRQTHVEEHVLRAVVDMARGQVLDEILTQANYYRVTPALIIRVLTRPAVALGMAPAEQREPLTKTLLDWYRVATTPDDVAAAEASGKRKADEMSRQRLRAALQQ